MLLQEPIIGTEDTATAEADECFYSWTLEDLEKCSIIHWYKLCKDFTIRSKMIKVPIRAITYLQDESTNLPIGVDTSGTSAAKVHKQNKLNYSKNGNRLSSDESSDEDEENNGGWSSDELISSDESSTPIRGASPSSSSFSRFKDLDNWMTRNIHKLGGAVFPKINWKSPKDATWVAFNKSMKCFIPGDVYLLLKCSTRVADVMDNSIYAGCSNYKKEPVQLYLILRTWVDFSPAAEFRCFVIDKRLTGISQRDVSANYPSLKKERDNIIQDIHNFFQKLVPNIELTHYVFDVVRLAPTYVKLIDLNVFGLVTDPALFSYKELKNTYSEMLSRIEMVSHGGGNLLNTGIYGEPVFKYIDNESMLTYHPDVNVGPRL